MTRIQPEVGSKFGRWTLLENMGNRGRFRCDCGEEVVRHKSNIVSGKSRQCQACGGRQRALTRTNNYDEDWQKRRVYSYYRTSANNSGKEFALTEEESWILSQKACYYCWEKPALTVSVKWFDKQLHFNGLDRIDSSRGYTMDNVRPACWNCNSAKKSMGEDDFYKWVDRVYMVKESRRINAEG